MYMTKHRFSIVFVKQLILYVNTRKQFLESYELRVWDRLDFFGLGDLIGWLEILITSCMMECIRIIGSAGRFGFRVFFMPTD